MEKLPCVLLVDDDEATNFANERLLRQLAVADQVWVATCGEQALELLAQLPPHQPTLLLLDVSMPAMNGIEFLEAFRQLPATQQQATRIVMLATSMESKDLARLDELPIAGLVSKPLTREKVDTLLRLHFARQLPAE